MNNGFLTTIILISTRTENGYIANNMNAKCNSNVLLLNFATQAYLFSPDEGSCYVFPTRNNCCEFLASNEVIIQRVIQLCMKEPDCGASLSYFIQYLRKL